MYDFLFFMFSCIFIYIDCQNYRYKPLFKCIPLITLIIPVYNTLHNINNIFIFLGLLMSLLGDFFMIYDKYLNNGIICFQLAHMFYISSYIHTLYNILICLVFISINILILILNLKKEIIDIKYIYIIMLIMSLYFSKSLSKHKNNLPFLGTFLFVISDIIIAYHRFIEKIDYEPLLVMTPYFLAQYFISKKNI